jgi:aspartate 1-decarboxylase
MQRTMLKSKIHRATVTEANLDYQGSVTIDPLLMEAADILSFERVEIYNVTNGERLATYAIPGRPGAGEICLNGAAAHKARAGDLVILASYAVYEGKEIAGHRPSLVFVDERNRIAGSGAAADAQHAEGPAVAGAGGAGAAEPEAFLAFR